MPRLLPRINRVVIHQSASRRSTTVEAIRGWHLARGMRDIAYHYVIDGHAKIHTGRPVPEQGAHARGANGDSIGICVTGHNGGADGQDWTDDQRQTLSHLCSALRVVFPGVTFHGHRDVGSTATECPGCEIGRETGLPRVVRT